MHGCLACKAQIKNKDKFDTKKRSTEEFFIGQQNMPFHMLVRELIAKPKENPKEKLLQGCEVFFPDTLFYEKGAPSFIAHNDKDFCMAKWNDGEEKKQINANDIVQKLQRITTARKAHTDKFWLQTAKINRQAALQR